MLAGKGGLLAKAVALAWLGGVCFVYVWQDHPAFRSFASVWLSARFKE